MPLSDLLARVCPASSRNPQVRTGVALRMSFGALLMRWISALIQASPSQVQIHDSGTAWHPRSFGPLSKEQCESDAGLKD